MGIQGLLPFLKPIQIQRSLSEFAGQTLAVDAYVWLHRGAYACATELATGKPTTKYIDYSMHRVRLLKHNHVMPYVVFDGGPLPAKGGTEKEREKRRAENLDRANALAAQGRHTQAREHYVKCVDVTPQMAFQLIKALKAEGVPYVVAPYEADAQLAYLERAGLVDGIITEDSDLLVFGCRTVLFKLDTVASTVTCITRADFGSPALATTPGSLSLLGWSDNQFRWMAMLSGCDYLPSISGIGLKTAWALLRKYKTVQNAVRAVRLEGKKSIPKGYLEAFALAEKVFLHQRVYDPGMERLVYLTEIPGGEELDENAESYIGRYLDPSLAKKIAEGDVCPISLLPMEDINPSYSPMSMKPLPLRVRDQNTSMTVTAKGKQKEKAITGIMTFFAPVSKAAPKSAPAQYSTTSRPIVAGRASGKRTLVDIMDNDIAAKKKKGESEVIRRKAAKSSHSRYFEDANDIGCSGRVAGSSRPSPRSMPKEFVPPVNTPGIELEETEELADPVAQEDGYLSPSPSISRAVTPVLSSPARPHGKGRGAHGNDTDVEAVSSPVAARARGSRVLVRASPCADADADCLEPEGAGPDLRRNFDDELSSEIGCWDEKGDGRPATPPDEDVLCADGDEGWLDEDTLVLEARAAACARVADGWRAKFHFEAAGASPHSPRVARNVDASSLRRHNSTPLPYLARSGLRSRGSDPYPVARVKERVDSGVAATHVPEDVGSRIFESTKGRLDAFRYSSIRP